MKNKLLLGLATGLLVLGMAGFSLANTINWTSATPGTIDKVNGSIGSTSVTYQGDYSFVQLGTGVNYWTEPLPGSEPYTGSTVIDNAPTPAEMIALNYLRIDLISFSVVSSGHGDGLILGAPDSAPVPEPATMLLFGTGLAGLAGYTRRQAKKK